MPSGVPGRPSIQTRGITPVSLSRYIGEWANPKLNPIYRGPEPQFVELVVRDDTGALRELSPCASNFLRTAPGTPGCKAISRAL